MCQLQQHPHDEEIPPESFRLFDGLVLAVLVLAVVAAVLMLVLAVAAVIESILS